MSEAELIPKKASFTSRLALAFRPKQGGKKLTKAPSTIFRQNEELRSPALSNKSFHDSPVEANIPKAGPVNFYNKKPTGTNAQTGELWDEGEMLHSMLRRDSIESLKFNSGRPLQVKDGHDISRRPGEAMIASLPTSVWEVIKNHLNPTDAANLAISSKTLLKLIGGRPFGALNINGNHQFKIDFLLLMDRYLPNHLLCFPCAVYHLRIQNGQERFKANNVLNPVINCPESKFQSKLRLIPKYSLPFTFVQLAFRAEQFGPRYGISIDALQRRYRSTEDSDWFHQQRLIIHKGHLLLRVISKCYAPPGMPPAAQRNFLFSREDYTPYFSACSHWRDGELMNICKCALTHIPVPKLNKSQASQLQRNTSSFSSHGIVSLCSNCRPMRRCPECPTEYLVDIKLEEDRTEVPALRFKQCMIVTRWSDLGDGTNPEKGEWAACNGVDGVEYDSFGQLGRRAISGVFESLVGSTGPVQRIMNLNPKGEKKGEDGDNWY